MLVIHCWRKGEREEVYSSYCSKWRATFHCFSKSKPEKSTMWHHCIIFKYNCKCFIPQSWQDSFYNEILRSLNFLLQLKVAQLLEISLSAYTFETESAVKFWSAFRLKFSGKFRLRALKQLAGKIVKPSRWTLLCLQAGWPISHLCPKTVLSADLVMCEASAGDSLQVTWVLSPDCDVFWTPFFFSFFFFLDLLLFFAQGSSLFCSPARHELWSNMGQG